MSELTTCNYCNWQRYKKLGHRIARGAERKKVWTTDGVLEPRGVVVIDKQGKFVCWFAELPKHCCC